jgi:hypothetical protein
MLLAKYKKSVLKFLDDLFIDLELLIAQIVYGIILQSSIAICKLVSIPNSSESYFVTKQFSIP